MTNLAERAWPTAQTWATAVLVVPLGATEQHGPHLPLSTDSILASALADALAERTPGVVVAPTLPYGASGEHGDFPGTLSIGLDALEHVLVELGRSASGTTGRLLFLCTHGGNGVAVAAAVARLHAEGRDVRAWFPHTGGDAHAGGDETSLLLAVEPALVDRGRAVVGDPRPLEQLLPALRSEGVRAVSPSGVLGDPTDADAARGQQLFTRLVDELVELVRGWVR